MKPSQNTVNENSLSIDVVILTQDREQETIDAINSVLKQKEIDAVVWVVDQGSEPSVKARFQQKADAHSQVNFYPLETNLGVAGGRNYGMQLGSEDYIFVMDNDAELNDELTLARVVLHFQEEPALAVVGCKVLNYFTREYDRLLWVYPRSQFENRDDQFYTTRYVGCGHGLRRSALVKTTLYDNSLFFFWEEIDLSYQLIQQGYTIGYFPDCVVLHKVSPNRRFDWKQDRFYYLVRNAIYIDYKYFRSVRRLLYLTVGYMIKGIYNNTTRQTIRGVWDAIFMVIKRRKSLPMKLSGEAKAYIMKHELVYRGGLLSRIRKEVFEKLP
jgi:GT2 family glycosyltransferase